MDLRNGARKLLSQSVLIDAENRAFLQQNIDHFSKEKLQELVSILQSEREELKDTLEKKFTSPEGKCVFDTARENLRILKKKFVQESEISENKNTEKSLQSDLQHFDTV